MPAGRYPRFLVLEGLDGTGTTTQAQRVAEALREHGLAVCLTAEPSDGPIGRVLRTHVRGEIELDPHTAALAFTADRADHLERVIRPALASGETVVCDRYLLSTLAYQGAEGVDRRWILGTSRGLDTPDLTVLLDVPEAERATRMGSRTSVDRYEAPELAASLRESYLTSAEMLRAEGHRIVLVAGHEPPEVVTEQIVALLDDEG